MLAAAFVYGPQSGDNKPAISREEQQGQVVAATAQLIERLVEWAYGRTDS